MTGIEICTQGTDTPLVRTLASRVRRALTYPGYGDTVTAAAGSFVICDTRSPQQATVNIADQQFRITAGIRPGWLLKFSIDLRHPHSPDKVEGRWRHPIYTQKVIELLDFPRPNWQQAAEEFWQDHGGAPGMPPGIHIRCSDDQGEYLLGTPAGAVELFGNRTELTRVFNGEAVLWDSLVRGRLKGAYTWEQLSVLSGETLERMLGAV